MNDALQAIFDDLEANRDRFLDLLSGLDDAQLTFRPRPDSWSALDVAEHVLLAEQVSTATMLRLAGRPSKTRSLLQRLGYFAVWVVLKLRFRVSSPARITNPSSDTTLREIRAEWDTTRRRLRAYLEELEAPAADLAGFAHPVAGPLTLREGLLFLSRHVHHHQAQLERLLHHRRFPRARAALTAGAG